MQTKSNIQLIRESLAMRESFMNIVKELTDKYIVKDSVFEFNQSGLTEVVTGYMDILGEYASIEEAFKNMQSGDSLRIVENKTYQIGQIHKTLAESKSDKVYDITVGQMVSE